MPTELKKAIEAAILAYKEGTWADIFPALKHLEEVYEPVKEKL